MHLLSLMLASLFALACCAASSPLYSSLWTFYGGSDEATGLSWQGVALLNTATGNITKLCNLVFSDSGNPSMYGPGLTPSAYFSNEFLIAFGPAQGYTSIKKLVLGTVPLPKCIVLPGWDVNQADALIYDLAFDPVTSLSYVMVRNIANLFDTTSGIMKPIATYAGEYDAPGNIVVANNTLIWTYVGPSTTNVSVTNLQTNVTTKFSVGPINGNYLPSNAFFYYASSWYFLGTNVQGSKANLSAVLLSFDLATMQFSIVSSSPIFPLNSQYGNLRIVGGPLLDAQGYLYVMDEGLSTFLVYDVPNRTTVTYVPLTLDASLGAESNVATIVA